MLKMFAWDELNNEVYEQQGTAKVQREIDAETGWQYQEVLPNGVVVLATDRHYALECWACDKDSAHSKFLQFPYYKKFQQ